MNCPACKKKLPKGAAVCPACGQELPRPAEKNRGVVLLLAVLLVVVLAVVVFVFVDNPLKDSLEAQTQVTDNTPSAAESTKEETPEPTFTIPETVLLEEAGLTATATGISLDAANGLSVTISVQNATQKTVDVAEARILVNGYQLEDAYFYLSVQPGETGEGKVSFDKEELSACGIREVAEVDLQLTSWDDSTYEDLVTGELVKLETSAKGSFEQTYDDSGISLYDANGVKIVCRSLDNDDYSDGALLCYVENNREGEVRLTAQADSVLVNGEAADSAFDLRLLPGTRALAKLRLKNLEELELSSIYEVTELQFVLDLADAATGDALDETDPIVVTFE